LATDQKREREGEGRGGKGEEKEKEGGRERGKTGREAGGEIQNGSPNFRNHHLSPVETLLPRRNYRIIEVCSIKAMPFCPLWRWGGGGGYRACMALSFAGRFVLFLE
jgi:hypothetical protein